MGINVLFTSTLWISCLCHLQASVLVQIKKRQPRLKNVFLAPLFWKLIWHLKLLFLGTLTSCQVIIFLLLFYFFRAAFLDLLGWCYYDGREIYGWFFVLLFVNERVIGSCSCSESLNPSDEHWEAFILFYVYIYKVSQWNPLNVSSWHVYQSVQDGNVNRNWCFCFHVRKSKAVKIIYFFPTFSAFIQIKPKVFNLSRN